MTWNAATTVLIPYVTLLQKLGEGKSAWVELAFYLNDTVLQDADDGTSRSTGISGAADGVPADWSRYWQGISIDWGDGTFTGGLGNVGLRQQSTNTSLGAGPFYGERDGCFLPCHRYDTDGTFTISAVVAIQFVNWTTGEVHNRTGTIDLTTFTTGSAPVPPNTRPRQRLVAACANLNDGRDAGNFYDAQFLASARFSDLRSAGPCSRELGFHGVTARTPWAASPGYYYAYSFLSIGSSGTDVWLQSERDKNDTASTAEELDVWPIIYDRVYTKILDGGPSVGAHQPQVRGEDVVGSLGGTGLLIRTDYDHTTGDGDPGNYRLLSLATGASIATGTAPRPDWRPLMTDNNGIPLGSYHWSIMAGLNDQELLMGTSGHQFYGYDPYMPNRQYIANVVTGEVWLAYDITQIGAMVPDGLSPVGFHYSGPDFGICQSGDGAIMINVGPSSVLLYQAIFMVNDRAGRLKGIAPVRNGVGVAGTVTGDFSNLAIAYTAAIDPVDSRYVYIPIWGRDTLSDPRKSGIYRFDVTTGAYARVAWLRHPYGDAVDVDGHLWSAWDYIDHVTYGNPPDGDWLPPGPAILNLDYTPAPAYVGSPVRLWVRSPTGNRQGSITVTWGDGGTSIQANFNQAAQAWGLEHVYTAPGTYTVVASGPAGRGTIQLQVVLSAQARGTAGLGASDAGTVFRRGHRE